MDFSGRILFEGTFAAHRLDDEQKVRFRDFELSEPENSAPMLLALDKRQLFDQRFDGRLLALHKLHVNSIGLEVGADFDLIYLAGGDNPHKGKALQRFATRVFRAR